MAEAHPSGRKEVPGVYQVILCSFAVVMKCLLKPGHVYPELLDDDNDGADMDDDGDGGEDVSTRLSERRRKQQEDHALHWMLQAGARWGGADCDDGDDESESDDDDDDDDEAGRQGQVHREQRRHQR